ncbi:MAG: hypothetical protein KC441_02520 [Anaerolineales bacterium]|nr:hypothetical protein [Anaerolineales bacterium]
MDIATIVGYSLSFLAIGISYWSFRISKRTTRISIDQQLAQYSLQLNSVLLDNGIKGPYAHHLQIPDEKVEYFTKLAVGLFYHLNFLRYIYDNRDVLDENVLFAYKSWAKKIVKPWVESDEYLQKTWDVVVARKDIYGAEFIGWLETVVR